MDKPLPHQIEAAKILGARSILADKRGLGKTLSSLLWSEYAQRLLVIAPKEVAENFLEEIELWFPQRLPFNLIGKSAIERRVILQICSVLDSFTVVVNLEAWRKDDRLVHDLINLHFDTVIIDEAHNIKDERTLAFKGVRDIVYTPNTCLACGHHSLMELPNGIFCQKCFSLNTVGSSIGYIQMLTGTPLLNHPLDFFPLLHLKDRLKFPSQDAYKRKYCYQGVDGRWRFIPGAEKRLLAYLGSDYLSRSREDAGIIIPPHKPQMWDMDFTKEKHPNQWEIYKQLKDYAAVKIDECEAVNIMSMLALITRLRQCIVWPAGMSIPIRNDDGEVIGNWKCDVKESVKLDEAEKLAHELHDEGERVVIFSQFKAPLYEMHRRLGGKSVILDGQTSPIHRAEIRRDFDRRHASSHPKWHTLLAQYRVGGESLNFNAATAGIVLDRQWNPGKEDQGIGRYDRMGQTEETSTYILRAHPSIDEWHHDIIKYKLDIWNNFEEVRQSLKKHLEA